MLCCKGCHQLFHLECCALAENDAKKYPFYCEGCKPERTYKVEAIRGMKITPNGRMFLIKWVGYEKMTYEIEDDLKDCISIVNAYLQGVPKKQVRTFSLISHDCVRIF